MAEPESEDNQPAKSWDQLLITAVGTLFSSLLKQYGPKTVALFVVVGAVWWWSSPWWTNLGAMIFDVLKDHRAFVQSVDKSQIENTRISAANSEINETNAKIQEDNSRTLKAVVKNQEVQNRMLEKIDTDVSDLKSRITKGP